MTNQAPQEALLVLHFRGETMPDQAALIEAWRQASAENEAVYQELFEIWQDAAERETAPTMNLDEGWKRLEHALFQQKPVAAQPTLVAFGEGHARRKSRQVLFAMAAAVIIAVSIGAVWLLNAQGQDILVAKTSVGEQKRVTLPDGSVVILDSGSELLRNQTFGKASRVIRLKGHAFFKVKPQKIPFLVHTEQAIVTVLGTSFDVWAGNSKTKVSVKEGLVGFQARNSQSRVELGPNQYSTCRRNQQPQAPAEITIQTYFSWIEGMRSYKGLPAADVALDLERVFGKKVVFSPESLGEQTLTATFKDESFIEILKEICLTLNMEYIEKEGTYILTQQR